MTQAPPKPRRWLLAVDPRVYHWDTLFVKGKEMWRHAGSRPDAARQLKQVHKGDRTLCYHGKPEHSLYALAEVTRDPYPDPEDSESKKMVMDLRAIERLPQRMRAAVVLRYYEDMSEAEIANVLGVSLGTVKSTVSRAVAKLRIDADLLEG